VNTRITAHPAAASSPSSIASVGGNEQLAHLLDD
jgi:hypothetical protein